MNEEVLRRIKEEKEKRTGKLDLSNLGLKAIPEEVGKMDGLTYINANMNKISDISPLKEMNGIKTNYLKI